MSTVAHPAAERTPTTPAPASRRVESHATRLARILDWVELAAEQLATGAKVSTWAWRAPDRPWDVDGTLMVDVRPSQAPKLLEQRRPRKVDPDLPDGFVALTNHIAKVAEHARRLARDGRHPAAVMLAHALDVALIAADGYVAARGAGLEISTETRRCGDQGGEPDEVLVTFRMRASEGETNVERAKGRALNDLHEQHPWAFPTIATEESRRFFTTEIRRRAVRILNARGLKGAAVWRAAEKVREERRARESGATKVAS